MFQKILRPKLSSALSGKTSTLVCLGNARSSKNFFIFNNQNSLIVNLWKDFVKKKQISECQKSTSTLKLRARLFGLFKGKTFDFLKKHNKEEKSLRDFQKLQKIDLSENDQLTLNFLTEKLKKKVPKRKKSKVLVPLNSQKQFENFLFEVQNAQTVVDLLSEENKGGLLICEFEIQSTSRSKKKPSKGLIR